MARGDNEGRDIGKLIYKGKIFIHIPRLVRAKTTQSVKGQID